MVKKVLGERWNPAMVALSFALSSSTLRVLPLLSCRETVEGLLASEWVRMNRSKVLEKE